MTTTTTMNTDILPSKASDELLRALRLLETERHAPSLPRAEDQARFCHPVARVHRWTLSRQHREIIPEVPSRTSLERSPAEVLHPMSSLLHIVTHPMAMQACFTLMKILMKVGPPSETFAFSSF